MAEASLPAAVDSAAPAANDAVALQTPPAGDWRARVEHFARQPAIRRALPAIIAVGAIAVAAALYLMIAQGPQRVLYSTLTDGERAKVVETLERAGIGYTIDNATGMLTVGEDDLYRARMMVASDAGLAAPQSATDMLDSIPLGSSRTLEGERLRLVRERELMLTIREIDGIEAVRVHLATPERSVFVRENNPPSASIMVRLVGGRTLGQDQVEAIVNLVSGSVPGLSPEAVRVVDHNGRLLSSQRESSLDGLLLQREFEAKLREQVTTLLLPLLGDGNFSSQVQVELDQSEVMSARESYDPQGVVRSESEREALRMGEAGVGGVPGVLANTPPPPTEVVEGAPDPQAAEEGAAANVENRETSAQRDYELGREVAVTNTRPGGLTKLSVAVAVSEAALAEAAPMTAEQLQELVSAAVGADTARGDRVQVVVSAFESTELAPMQFYEQPWFATVLRYVAALLAIVLVLLLAVRPLIKRVRGEDDIPKNGEAVASTEQTAQDERSSGRSGQKSDDLEQQVELARQLAASQPDRAVATLQRMLQAPVEAKGA